MSKYLSMISLGQTIAFSLIFGLLTSFSTVAQPSSSNNQKGQPTSQPTSNTQKTGEETNGNPSVQQVDKKEVEKLLGKWTTKDNTSGQTLTFSFENNGVWSYIITTSDESGTSKVSTTKGKYILEPKTLENRIQLILPGNRIIKTFYRFSENDKTKTQELFVQLIDQSIGTQYPLAMNIKKSRVFTKDTTGTGTGTTGTGTTGTGTTGTGTTGTGTTGTGTTGTTGTGNK